MSEKRAILISLDALGYSDMEYIKTLPNFKKIMKKGAYCERELSVYPSLTFPVHASIVTGVKPNKHRIVNNYFFNPYSDYKRWNSFSREIAVKSLWDYMDENGKKVLSLSWPVSAGAKIKYNLPEVSPAKPKIWTKFSFLEQLKVWFQYGCLPLALRSLFAAKGLVKSWFFGKQPELDESMIGLMKNCLKVYNYDLAMLHIYGLDDSKHKHGILAENNKEYLRLYDDFIGEIMDYVDSLIGEGEDILLMFTGDHSQLDIKYTVHGNHILNDIGYLSYTDGLVTNYDFVMHSGDGMAYIYSKNENPNSTDIDKIATAFSKNPGVGRVMYPDEFIPFGCDNKAVLVFEAAPLYAFEDLWCQDKLDENFISPSENKAMHGYLPTCENYETLFFSYGNQVISQKIESMSVLDIMPTICKFFGVEHLPIDGKALEDFFAK